MSEPGQWTYKVPITVWPIGSTDEWGQPSTGTPFVFFGSWQRKSEARISTDGREFMSRSSYWTQYSLDAAIQPKIGDYLKIGDHTSIPEPPSDAEVIQSVNGDGAEMFGGSNLPDWEVVT